MGNKDKLQHEIEMLEMIHNFLIRAARLTENPQLIDVISKHQLNSINNLKQIAKEL